MKRRAVVHLLLTWKRRWSSCDALALGQVFGKEVAGLVVELAADRLEQTFSL